MKIKRTKIKSIRKLDNFKDEYVYDIGMKNESHPWFFGNNILLHNSVYFSAWPVLKDQVARGEVEWSKELCIQLYDSITESVNAEFPKFMKAAFNCPEDKGSIISSSREIVARKGLFITKKRYALLYFDKDGKRVDVKGKDGKIKAMGLDLKRADTPKFVQEFLLSILDKVLHGSEREEVINMVMAFKTEFKALKPWQKGSPKRVNNLTSYTEKEIDQGRANLPGHVRAAMNWNRLRKLHNDNHSMKISDGQKAIVCSIKPNALGYTSVAYPTDELRLPQWFLDLPFDEVDMELAVVDKKVDNLLSVLNWDIQQDISTATSFNDLFSFE